MADGMTPADVYAVTRPAYNYGGGYGDGFGFGGSGLWLFAILAMMMFGGNGFGWGNNGFANAIGYENLATSNEVQRGFDNQNQLASQREILSAVNAGTAQAVSATNQAKYDNINVAKDIQMALSSQISNVANMETAINDKIQTCCCETQRAIDGVNYANALNTASINATTTAQTQKILDALAQSKIEALQGKIQQLELANQLSGVVKYPSASTYNAGFSPFCNGCGCGLYA
jgi:hypothetical protein